MKVLIMRTELTYTLRRIIINMVMCNTYMQWLYISLVRQIKIVTSKLMIVSKKGVTVHTLLTVNEFGYCSVSKKIACGLVVVLTFYFSFLMRPYSNQTQV